MTFTEVDILHFRGIRSCHLQQLGLVNLFFGKNNCGKSSLLEALFVMSGPANPTLPVVVNNLRDLRNFSEENLKVEFFDSDVRQDIVLSSEGDGKREVRISMIESHSNQVELEHLRQSNAERVGRKYGLKFLFSVAGEEKKYHTELLVEENGVGKIKSDRSYKEELYAEFIDSGKNNKIDEHLAAVLKDKKEEEILDALRIIEPRIKDIQLIDGNVMVDVGLSTRLPINVLGDGVRKILSVVLSVHRCQNGVLMIDEMDNGLHYSVMSALWKTVLHLCKRMNTQLFISTHSMDMVKALVAAQDDETEEIVSAYKLIRNEKGDLAALRYGMSELTYAVKQEMEVR